MLHLGAVCTPSQIGDSHHRDKQDRRYEVDFDALANFVEGVLLFHEYWINCEEIPELLYPIQNLQGQCQKPL